MPVRSRETRRRRVARSAPGEGLRTSFSRRARMNRSIGVLGQAAFFTAGSGGRFGGINDQGRTVLPACRPPSADVPSRMPVSRSVAHGRIRLAKAVMGVFIVKGTIRLTVWGE